MTRKIIRRTKKEKSLLEEERQKAIHKETQEREATLQNATQSKPKLKQNKTKPKATPTGPRLNAKKLLSEIEGLNRGDFEQLLKGKQPQRVRVGHKVWGTIVREQDDLFFVDIQAKSEAFLWKEQLRDKKVKIGSRIEVFIVQNNQNGIQVSQNVQATDFADLEQAYRSKTPIQALVTGHNKGGYTLRAGDIRGFCPLTQIDIDTSEPETYLSKEYTFLITEIKPSEFIASRRILMEEKRKEENLHFLSGLNQGDRWTGIVKNRTDFGVFIQIETVQGLIPNRKIPPETILEPESSIPVIIDTIDINNQKFSLRLDRSDPWLQLGKTFQVNHSYTGKVKDVIEYGVLVELCFDLVGLLHHSKIPAEKSMKTGEEITVYIQSFDINKRRLRLQLEPSLVVDEHSKTKNTSLN
ncbi:MAG: S1 RNA-binding domain-containing protein, partial [Myxococcota bacterium]|nr:S1 RNA-binding domain-containing protein [Myxococcota bacterium]